jgi:hypothetical protein
MRVSLLQDLILLSGWLCVGRRNVLLRMVIVGKESNYTFSVTGYLKKTLFMYLESGWHFYSRFSRFVITAMFWTVIP